MKSITEYIEIQLKDPDNSLFKLITHIKDLASPGHSFDVTVDPKSRDEKSFGMDGDGAFFIKDIKIKEDK